MATTPMQHSDILQGGGETSNGLDTAMYIDTCGMHAQSHTSRRLQEESYRTKEKEKELVS